VNNISVHRYKHPQLSGWAGWLEPDDKSWIAFIGLDGVPRFFLSRDPVSGAICPDDESERAAHIAALAEERKGPRPGGHTGEPDDGSADWGGQPAPLAVGEPVFPLGVDGRGSNA
jgi:hypothetical protein